jgi:large subunit ribosomal protein L30
MKIAILRIRGIVKVRSDIAETMNLLGLKKTNSCVIVELTPVISGMITKIKDYVTYGEVSDETIKLLDEKRAVNAIKNESKSVYFLAPPKGGFERKGIKKPFSVGGVLGNRKDKINDLISKMV